MTNISSLLIGALCIASVIMCWGARVVMAAQINAGERWMDSKALQLSSAIYLHALSAIPAFAATLLAGDKPVSDPIVYLLWGTWTGWLIAKSIVIWVTGNLKIALALYALWTLIWIAWRLNVGG